MSHIYIFLTIIFASTSQLIIKWKMSTQYSNLPENTSSKIFFLLNALFDPFIIVAVLLTLISSLSWMAAMTKFDLSYAYPFIGLTFISQLIFAYIFFNESLTIYKIVGVIFISIGIFISSKSM